jgi:hypothetical protein
MRGGAGGWVGGGEGAWGICMYRINNRDIYLCGDDTKPCLRKDIGH